MSFLNSWQEVETHFGLDLDQPETFANQPYELLNVMIEMMNEINQAAIYNTFARTSKISTLQENAAPDGDVFVGIANNVSTFFQGNAYVKQIDSSGDLITDFTHWNGALNSEMSTWTVAGMEDHLGMERPYPTIETTYCDAIASADWLWWHLSAMKLMHLVAIHRSYTNPFKGFRKEATGSRPTWVEAVAAFVAAPWVKSFTFHPGQANTYFTGHNATASLPSNYSIIRTKITDLKFRLPQFKDSVLQGKKCMMYHYPVSQFHEYDGYSYYSQDYVRDASRDSLYLEKPQSMITPTYDEPGSMVDKWPIGDIADFPSLTVREPVLPEHVGWFSNFTHFTLGESHWGTDHRTFFDFNVPGGFSYADE